MFAVVEDEAQAKPKETAPGVLPMVSLTIILAGAGVETTVCSAFPIRELIVFNR